MVNRMRHMHASEVALANGLDPGFEGFYMMPPRIALAGVGQLATPFQGAWVLSNALMNIQSSGLPVSMPAHPLNIMKNMAFSLFQQRDRLLGFPAKTDLMLRFEMAASLWGNPDAHEIMKSFTMPDPTEATKVVQKETDRRMPSSPGSVPMYSHLPAKPSQPESVHVASFPKEAIEPSFQESVPTHTAFAAMPEKPSHQESVPKPSAENAALPKKSLHQPSYTWNVSNTIAEVPDMSPLSAECAHKPSGPFQTHAEEPFPQSGGTVSKEGCVFTASVAPTPSEHAPTLFQAMPLPRLGCGGPSYMHFRKHHRL